MSALFIIISIAMLGGLLMSRLAKMLKLPAVTAYLIAGLILGPFCLGQLGIAGIGFTSLEQVESFGIISQAAMGFIAFTIGNEFRLAQLKTMGKQAIVVGILQAVVTTIVVDIALIALHFIFPNIISLPAAITLGAIASATEDHLASAVHFFHGVVHKHVFFFKRHRRRFARRAEKDDRIRSACNLAFDKLAE